MPITLPPTLPPLQSEVAVVDRAPSIGEAAYHEYRLHVHGPESMRWLPFKALAASANSLSDAVYKIGAAAYAAGFPAAQVLYAAAGQDIHVLLVLGHVTALEGDPRLTPFFGDVAGTQPLRASTLERDRLLASAHADRLGLRVQPQLEPQGNGEYALRLDAKHNPGVEALRVEAGNLGNRYVGRYLGGLSLTVAAAGTQFDAGAHRGIARWNETGARYDDQSARLSRAMPAGAFAVWGEHVSFQRPVSGFETDNRLWQYGASWLYPLYADLRHRRTVQLSLDRTDRRTQVLGATYFEEAYASAQLSSGNSVAFYPDAQRRFSIDYGFTLRKGFGERDPPLSSADLGYFLARPTLAASYKAASPLRVRFDAGAQFSGDVVPEQQQWVIGGANTLTAYLPGVGVGDSGYGTRIEARWERPDGWRTPTPRAFVECARARLARPTADQPHGGVFAADAGAALDFTGRSYRASLAYAEPFAQHGFVEASRDASRVHLLFFVQLTFH